MLAFLVSVPVALAVEGSALVEAWQSITATTPAIEIFKLNIVTGLFFYM